MVLEKVNNIFLPPVLKEQAVMNLSLVGHQPGGYWEKGFSHLSQEKPFLPLCSSFLCLLISAKARQEKAHPWKPQTWWETWS